MRYAVTYPLTLIVEAPDETEAEITAEHRLEWLATSRTWLDHLGLDATIEPTEPRDFDEPHILPEDFAV